MDTEAYRHELKYIAEEKELLILENKLKGMCRRDKNADSNGEYIIRSAYFDTQDNAFYYENEAGVDTRKKYRMRIYNYSSAYIKLECKWSVRGMKRKESNQLSREQCDKLLQGRTDIVCEENQILLKRFLTEGKSRIYTPKVIVEYRRNAYVFPIGNVRITFDRHIMSSDALNSFFDKNMPKRLTMPDNMNILEIKYDELLPDFLWGLLNGRAGGLQRSSFSKYYICRKNALH